MSEHLKPRDRAPQTYAQFIVLDSHSITPHKNPNILKVTITAPRIRPSIFNPVLSVSLSLIGHLGRSMSLLVCQGWGQACGLSSKIPPASGVNLVLSPSLPSPSRSPTQYPGQAWNSLCSLHCPQACSHPLLPAVSVEITGVLHQAWRCGGMCALLWPPESVWPQCERALGVNAAFPVARALLSCCSLWITLMTGLCLLIYSEPLRFCWTTWALYCVRDWHCRFGRFFFLSKFGVM